MKAQDPIVREGTEVGGYRIEHPLGQGGMGTVFAAVEPTIGKRVAIKVLKSDLVGDPSHAARFEREARSVTLVRHPSVVDVFAFGKLSDGRPYFVMPLLAGRSLREELARAGRLDPKEAWRIAREVASGLAAAHGVGVLHRDLKPDNVFLVEYPGRPSQPILLDFGLAKRTDAGSEELDPKDAVKLTATGVPMGTPIYMAPEQWWSQPSSHATDQYAFGVVLFEMLAGRPPFDAQVFAELLQQHLHKSPPSLRELGVDATEALESFLKRLLAKEPAQRFADFSELIAQGDLAFATAGETAAPELAPRPIAPHTPAASAQTAREEDSLPVPGARPPVETARTELAPPSAVGSISGHHRTAKRWFAACLSLVAVPFVGVGYAGSLRWQLGEWVRSIGWGAILILVSAAAALVTLPWLASKARMRPGFAPVALGVALLPAAASLTATFTGWVVVTRGVDKLPPGPAFQLMHAGFYEIALGPFLGFGLSAALTLGLVVLLGPPHLRWSTPWSWVALVMLGGAGLALALGAPSAATVLFPSALAVALLSTWAELPSTLSRERALAAISCVLCARSAAQSRTDATIAAVWFETNTRAERVDAVIRAAAEQRWSFAAQVVAVAAIALVALLVVRRAKLGGLLDADSAQSRWVYGGISAALAIVIVTPTFTIERDLDARRTRFVGMLNEQFGFFAKLDPPSLADRSLAQPVTSPALQITEDRVALNGEGIGKLTALDTPRGRQSVAAAIVSGLAASPTEDNPARPGATLRTVDLSLLIDRRVPWRRVEEVLSMAFEGGARNVDLLLTRGEVPVIPASAPPEAGHVMPEDFVALPLELSPQGPKPDREASYAQVTTELLSHAGAGVVALQVGVAPRGE